MTKVQRAKEAKVWARKEELWSYGADMTKEEQEELDSLPYTTQEKELDERIQKGMDQEEKDRRRLIRTAKELYALKIRVPRDFYSPLLMRHLRSKALVEYEEGVYTMSYPLKDDRDGHYMYLKIIRKLNPEKLMVENPVWRDVINAIEKQIFAWTDVKL